MAFELRGFLTGIALELSANPLFLDTGKKIVAYSYNGTVLPELPEWDREMYPYAALNKTSGSMGLLGYYRLLCAATPFACENGTAVTYSLPAIYALVKADMDTTVVTMTEVEEASAMALGVVIWANHDIDSEDGTVYLAASEPVPVYE